MYSGQRSRGFRVGHCQIINTKIIDFVSRAKLKADLRSDNTGRAVHYRDILHLYTWQIYFSPENAIEGKNGKTCFHARVLRHSRIVEGSVACRQELVYLWEAGPLSEMPSSVFALVFTSCVALSLCNVSLTATKQQDLIKSQEKCGKVSEYFGEISPWVVVKWPQSAT